MKDLDFATTMTKVEEEEEYNIYIEKNHLDSPELSWSPPDDHLETLSPLIHNVNPGTRHRSGSINSDSSLNSYSTVTVQQYSRYGMTPMIYQSDSTSTSSRTPSRLSNYSTSSQTSSNTTAALPRPRKVSATSTGMPSPSRSISNRDESHLLPRAHSRLGTSSHHTSTGGGCPSSAASAACNGRSKLAKRASHIPSPSSNASPKSPSIMSGSRLTAIPSSSKSTGVPGGRPVSRFGTERGNGTSRSGASSMTTAAGSTTARKLASRASHIPSVHERSTSPISGRNGSSIRNSVFGLRRDDNTASQQQQQQQSGRRGTVTPNHLRSPENQRRNASPIAGKPTGMRPPADTRSSSRIGFRKL
ncbi:hypothetical protein BCR42DRAFT_68007 [Absidia repens]|uniref:Uncharacterized protein n=1 Tax=Absidia repens TaxID=90262 RepID=A0A1X2IC91_9FUNG|nr:hypothetical protein BCR42DRAFT_68007 [Absidia repens]